MRAVAGPGAGRSPTPFTAHERSVPTVSQSAITVEVSVGELLDKITILEIKKSKFEDPAKLRNVTAELETLARERDRALDLDSEAQRLVGELEAVNRALWDIEDEIRACEREGDFGPRFVELARSVYKRNDRRAALKRELNERLGSRLVEEKSYSGY